MPQTKKATYKEFSPYFIHISTTNRCNARCHGCINSTISKHSRPHSTQEINPIRDSKAIENIVSTTKNKDVVICLYGGEPLLRPDVIRKFMAEIEKKISNIRLKYILYTNGQLLDIIHNDFPDILKRLWLISISIDGKARQHHSIRPGTNLARIENNLKGIKKTYSPHILMWSTLREEQSLWNCFQEFQKLHRQKTVDSLFWHWIEAIKPIENFPRYIRRYESDLRAIMDIYLQTIAQTGVILPLTHINELLLFLFTRKKRGTTACAVELQKNLDIVNGKIYACADLPGELTLGSIKNNGEVNLRAQNLSRLIEYKKHLRCTQCGVEFYCGGRCPILALTAEPERIIQYCQLMRLHVATVTDYAPKIGRQIQKHKISLQEIYNSSVILNQFTDVTP